MKGFAIAVSGLAAVGTPPLTTTAESLTSEVLFVPNWSRRCWGKHDGGASYQCGKIKSESGGTRTLDPRIKRCPKLQANTTGRRHATAVAQHHVKTTKAGIFLAAATFTRLYFPLSKIYFLAAQRLAEFSGTKVLNVVKWSTATDHAIMPLTTSPCTSVNR